MLAHKPPNNSNSVASAQENNLDAEFEYHNTQTRDFSLPVSRTRYPNRQYLTTIIPCLPFHLSHSSRSVPFDSVLIRFYSTYMVSYLTSYIGCTTSVLERA